MEGLLSAEITIVELLLLVSIVAMVAQRIRIPYTVVLVLAGLGLSFLEVPLQTELTSEIILLLIETVNVGHSIGTYLRKLL